LKFSPKDAVFVMFNNLVHQGIIDRVETVSGVKEGKVVTRAVYTVVMKERKESTNTGFLKSDSDDYDRELMLDDARIFKTKEDLLNSL